MARRTPLAWLQLRRQPFRTLVGVAGVAFAVTLVFMQLGFAKALFASAVRFHQHLRTDVVLVNPLSEMLPRMAPSPAGGSIRRSATPASRRWRPSTSTWR